MQRINRKSHEPKDLKTLLRYEKENGSKLTLDETRYIFETNTIGLTGNGTFNVNDIVETVNHFRCVDMIIEQVNHPVSESFLKKLHLTLKNGTDDSRKDTR